MEKTTVFKDLNEGDILSETTYYKVEGKRVNHIEGVGLAVITSSGSTIRIAQGIVEDSLVSASQFDREEKVTQTQLAEKLAGVGDSVFEVSFRNNLVLLM